MASKYIAGANRRQEAKTINKAITLYVKAAGVSATATSSLDVTNALTSALAGQGSLGQDLELKLASSSWGADGDGIEAGKKVELYDSTTGEKLQITTAVKNEEIYGIITEASGVYTLSYYYLDQSGNEQSVSLDAAQSIDIEFTYSKKFEDVRKDDFIAISVRHVEQEISSNVATIKREYLTATADNTLPDLALTPKAGDQSVVINFTGHILEEVKGDFTVAGKVITWDPAVIGYVLESGEKVSVTYNTLES